MVLKDSSKKISLCPLCCSVVSFVNPLTAQIGVHEGHHGVAQRTKRRKRAMIIKKKLGNLKDIDLNDRMIDHLELEWYETTKRILHKRTNSEKEVSLRFLNENPHLTEGDILYSDEQHLIVIVIKPCQSILIKPATMYQMAYI